MATQTIAAATGPAKLEAVKKIVDKLSEDMDSLSLNTKERDDALEELKVYGREPRDADPIFTNQGISMLFTYAFDSQVSDTTSRGALRVLANSMVLKPGTRDMFVNGGYVAKACAKLDTESWDDEFLLARIIFLSTYTDSIKTNILPLIEKHSIAGSITANLARHAALDTEEKQAAAGPMEEMALPETLRLLFNVAHFCAVNSLQESIRAFNPAAPHIVALLLSRKPPTTRSLDPPYGSLINALSSLDLDLESVLSALFPDDDATKLSARFISVLDDAMQQYPNTDRDVLLSPLVDILCKMYSGGPELVKDQLRNKLLPSAEDREAVLGQGPSLSARLLKASTDPMAPKLGQVISHLLFLMSDEDASKFVENVGYGYASGYLFQNNVPMPASAQTASGADESDSQRPVNPITGQFMDRENPVNLPPMTEEEKEREAERLFVLFERLKKNGVLSVQNPIEKAAREGKFRDLKEDEVEEIE